MVKQMPQTVPQKPIEVAIDDEVEVFGFEALSVDCLSSSSAPGIAQLASVLSKGVEE